ncbi:uncharacterized protein [Physcomitrium patens]|uniref:Uncharacterized protein n=1 Tax=Physcomitrium patens TaxID=3218 RepID=A0A2K1JKD5_PHYPA|nr:uncharacterized protein LOC112290189 [Physcomitrium patens]XP_024391994.1 uncharacterized protein LOC112290189 [Physcomitrium patens]PNR42040.1 hypothetical protein PHYPA_016869 [Physcomitrium patens]|eukprot:XP_024391993.1 uncharacterized protein LOC112290189 [Physcomitrella patens]
MCESNVGQVLNRSSEPGVWFVLRRLITGSYHFAIRSFQQEYCLRLHDCLAKALTVTGCTGSIDAGGFSKHFLTSYWWSSSFLSKLSSNLICQTNDGLVENGTWSGLKVCVILMALVC